MSETRSESGRKRSFPVILRHDYGPWLERRLEAYSQLRPRLLSSILMILAATVTSFVAVAYAGAIDWATTMASSMSTDHRWLFVGLSPLWLILAWALVRFGDPKAGGSGIPQVLAAIDLTDATVAKQGTVKAWPNIRLILIKVASSLTAILGGGAVGREGPTIQISAAIFELFDGAFRNIVSRRRSRESLLIAGAAAGLAAAFNTPLGGVVFAIEELARDHFRTFKGVLILSVVTAGYVTQAMLGPYLFVGHPTIGTVSWQDSGMGMLVGVILGGAGAMFGWVLFAIGRRTAHLSIKSRLGLAATAGIIMSLMCVVLGPNASGGGSLLIRGLLFGQIKDISWGLAIWRVLGLVITYMSGCAGGIFAPSLAAGAALGAKLGGLFATDNVNLMMVLGMIAFLTGATRSPFTSFILVFEMTDRQAAVVPMMAAALLANIAAKFVESESFYEKSRDQILAGYGMTHISEP